MARCLWFSARSGRYRFVEKGPSVIILGKTPCPDCEGFGRTKEGKPCSHCEGTGLVTVQLSAPDSVPPTKRRGK